MKAPPPPDITATTYTLREAATGCGGVGGGGNYVASCPPSGEARWAIQPDRRRGGHLFSGPCLGGGRPWGGSACSSATFRNRLSQAKNWSPGAPAMQLGGGTSLARVQPHWRHSPQKALLSPSGRRAKGIGCPSRTPVTHGKACSPRGHWQPRSPSIPTPSPIAIGCGAREE